MSTAFSRSGVMLGAIDALPCHQHLGARQWTEAAAPSHTGSCCHAA